MSEETIILAGDVAIRSGLALGSTSRGLIASTVIDMGEKRRAVSLMRAMKHLAIRTERWARRFVDHVDIVIYEEPTPHQKSSNRLPQYAMVSGLLWAGDSLGASQLGRYWPSSIKKRGAGYGKADKAAMCRMASRYAGREIESHDEADAILLLKVALFDARRPKELQEVSF